MVMELAGNGSLQRLLRQQRHAHFGDVIDDDSDPVTSSPPRHYNLTSSDLILFGVHVASGMEYVSSQRVSILSLTLRAAGFVWLLSS